VAVQFSLSYDANGDPVLVENTVTGTRKVVSTSPVVSEYKSRFETPAEAGTDAPDNIDTPEEGNDIYRYINEMENNADNDMNLSFVDKQNLGRYTPETIEARNKPKTRTQSVMETIALAMIPYGNAAKGVVKALSKILPQESEEIRAIKQFYADPEMSTLVDDIPGMSNYNLVYGNPFDPSYGLADAADKRTATMAKTLARKYGMTAAEIEMAKVGTYTGDVDSDLIKRIKKTTDLSRKEREQKAEQQYKTTASEELKERTTNIGDVTGAQQRQANRDARAIESAYRNETGRDSSYSGGESTPGDDTSYSDPFDPGGGE